MSASIPPPRPARDIAKSAGAIASVMIVSVFGASGAVWAAGLKPYSWWLLGGSLVPRSSRALRLTARASLWIGLCSGSSA